MCFFFVLFTIKTNVGLGIYADSDNSGNSSSDDSNDESQSDEIDSDVDLKVLHFIFNSFDIFQLD